MQVKYVSIYDLKPYENNPRKNNKAVDQVIKSIEAYGFKNPILIDENNVIIAGHTRYKASQQMGIAEVPTIMITDLTEEQKKGYRIADNRTTEFAEWDYDLLKIELDELEEFTGFDFQQLNNELDYSNKNKEIDLNNIEESYELKLKFTEKEYFYVCEKLNDIDKDMKEAVLKVLEYEI